MTNAYYTRRTFLRIAGGTAFAAPFVLRTGIGTAHAATTFTVMTVGGSWGKAIEEMIAEPFAKQNGVEMAYDRRPNAEQIAALVAMRGNPTVDCDEVGGPRIGQAIALNLFEELDLSIVTQYEHVLPAFKTPHFVGRIQVPMAFTFNTKYVKREEAEEKGWELMLDPKYAGRAAIPKFGWMGEMWMNAVNQAMGGSYDNLDPIIGLCHKILHDNNGLVMASNDQGMRMFTTEEIWLAPFWTGRTYQLKDKGVPLDFVYPPGWVSYYTGFGVVKGTPNKDLAMKFVNKTLEPAVQKAMAERFSDPPTNKLAMPLVAHTKRLQIPDAAWKKAARLDYYEMYRYTDKQLARWQTDVLG